MSLLKQFAFLAIILAGTMAMAKDPERIVIDPALKNYDSIPAIKSTLLFWVDTVQDTTHSKDSGVVGYAHTRSRQPSPIVCKPLAGEAVRQSFETLFTRKGVAAPDRSSATHAVQIVLLGFTLKETPHFLYQTMEAVVRFEVRLTDLQTGQTVRQFTIDSQRSRGAFDAGRKAEQVARDALCNALSEAVRTLNSL
jgi:hypothetical protein